MKFPWSLPRNLAFDQNSSEFHIDSSLRKAERFRVEREKLLAAWSTVAIGQHSDGTIFSIVGSIEPVQGVLRDFEIKVPKNYPYGAPESYSVGWELTGPHKYSSGKMCLWPPNHWNPSRTLAYAVAKSFVWIHKHEAFLSTGQWPGNEVKH